MTPYSRFSLGCAFSFPDYTYRERVKEAAAISWWLSLEGGKISELSAGRIEAYSSLDRLGKCGR